MADGQECALLGPGLLVLITIIHHCVQTMQSTTNCYSFIPTNLVTGTG